MVAALVEQRYAAYCQPIVSCKFSVTDVDGGRSDASNDVQTALRRGAVT
jgi:hypothetical protein